MAARRPLVVSAGQVQQLPIGDVEPHEYAVSSFTLADGQYAIMPRLVMTGAARATCAGASRLVLV